MNLSLIINVLPMFVYQVKDSSKIVCVGAHLDTIGMQVRHVMDNGWIEVKKLGWSQFP